MIRLLELEKRVGKIEKYMEKLSKLLPELEEEVKSKLEEHEHDISNLKQSLESAELDIRHLKEQLQGIKDETDGLGENVAFTNKRVKAIEETIWIEPPPSANSSKETIKFSA
jgi:chromosome segregation ATPase